MQNIYLNKHFNSGDIEEIAHEGSFASSSSTMCFSNIILFANFVTAYSFTSYNFIKYTFIKYQYLFNNNKK